VGLLPDGGHRRAALLAGLEPGSASSRQGDASNPRWRGSTAYVSPQTFPVTLSIALLVGAVIGGLASTAGPLLGGIFVYYLPIESNQWVPSQSWIPTQIASVVEKAGPAVTYGVVLILIMIFAPNGIVGLIVAGYARLRKRLRGVADRETGQLPPASQTVP
jgi:hypothetical protein